MKNPFAKMGWALLGIMSASELRVLDALIRKGGVWLASKIDPWLMAISSIAFVMTIVVMLSVSAFKRTGGMAGVGMAWASYFFGGWVWVYGFLLTYALWGVFGVLVTITRAINSPLKRVKFPVLGMRSLQRPLGRPLSIFSQQC